MEPGEEGEYGAAVGGGVRASLRGGGTGVAGGVDGPVTCVGRPASGR